MGFWRKMDRQKTQLKCSSRFFRKTKISSQSCKKKTVTITWTRNEETEVREHNKDWKSQRKKEKQKKKDLDEVIMSYGKIKASELSTNIKDLMGNHDR